MTIPFPKDEMEALYTSLASDAVWYTCAPVLRSAIDANECQQDRLAQQATVVERDEFEIAMLREDRDQWQSRFEASQARIAELETELAVLLSAWRLATSNVELSKACLAEANLQADEAQAQVADLTRRAEAAETCLGFFASVIKSGEPWTATCQAEYDKIWTANHPKEEHRT